MIRELAWRAVARIVTISAVTDWLIARAYRTPYTPITSRDGSDVYMVRLWLFNPYPVEGEPDTRAKWKQRMPSVRLHNILRADDDLDHPHDHPWDARTIVLGPGDRGYVEERPVSPRDLIRTTHVRPRGYTGPLQLGQYHVITWVPPGGVWTLFITWKKQGTWGFLVDGQKVPWRKYLGLDKPATVDHHPV